MSYHNTNNLTGNELKKANQKACSQEEAIMDIFIDNKGVQLTPSCVWEIYCSEFNSIPLTSIRRAITNLTNKHKLFKTHKMEEGIYGKPEHFWEIPKTQLSFCL